MFANSWTQYRTSVANSERDIIAFHLAVDVDGTNVGACIGHLNVVDFQSTVGTDPHLVAFWRHPSAPQTTPRDLCFYPGPHGDHHTLQDGDIPCVGLYVLPVG